MANSITRRQVLGFRVRAQQLDRDTGGNLSNTAVLDLGVQDTGPDGGLWALAIRGVDLSSIHDDTLFLTWTIRGAPHLYRREDLPSVAAAVEPFSSEDAGKRIYDASKPLKAAGIDTIEAMDTVAKNMASVVTRPMVKGEVSARLTERMGSPYLRLCRPCDATTSTRCRSDWLLCGRAWSSSPARRRVSRRHSQGRQGTVARRCGRGRGRRRETVDAGCRQ